MSKSMLCPDCAAETDLQNLHFVACSRCDWTSNGRYRASTKGMTKHEKVVGAFVTALVTFAFFGFLWAWAVPTYLRWILK